MVLLVCSGSLLGFPGIYKPFADYAGAGATVPLLDLAFLYEGEHAVEENRDFWDSLPEGFTASAAEESVPAHLWLPGKSDQPSQNETKRMAERPCLIYSPSVGLALWDDSIMDK